MVAGWVKLHRSIYESADYRALYSAEQGAVMIALIVLATHEPMPWSCKKCGASWTLKCGEFAYGRRYIANFVGCGEQVVRSTLKRLLNSGFISNHNLTSCHRTYTIRNYSEYQSTQPVENSKPNHNLTTTQPQPNPHQEHKNIRTEEVIKAAPPQLELGNPLHQEASELLSALCTVKVHSTDKDLQRLVDRDMGGDIAPMRTIVQWVTTEEPKFWPSYLRGGPKAWRKRFKDDARQAWQKCLDDMRAARPKRGTHADSVARPFSERDYDDGIPEEMQ